MEKDTLLVRESYQSVQEIATSILRQQILNQTLKPNERLLQDDLAARMGISRMPVRHALASLQAEGLVTLTPRGTVVSDMSEATIREAYLIRAALEGLATKYAVDSLSDEMLASLRTTLEKMRAAHEAGDREQTLAQVTVAYEALYESCGMPQLCGFIKVVRTNCERYRRAYMSFPGRTARAVEMHEELLAACEARDGDAAAAIMQAHIRETGSLLLEYVRKAKDAAASGDEARSNG